MSATDDEEIPGREVAYRLFAAEYDDASLSHTESDEERAPNYVVSPTGARLNRLFAVGTLTEITSVNEEMVRARVVDPTGAFVVYAGQYQPDALATLESLEPPAFVAVTGKARTFEPDDGDRIYTSVRPESIATVDAETRDRWVVSAAEQTLERIGTYAEAATIDARGEELTAALEDAGVERGLAAGLPLAQDHYGTTPAYLEALRDRALEAVAVVADERDQVQNLGIAPDGGDSDATFEALADLADVDIGDVIEHTATDAPTEPPSADLEDTPSTDSATGAVETSTGDSSDAPAAETVEATTEEVAADSASGDSVASDSNETDSSGVESTASPDKSGNDGVETESVAEKGDTGSATASAEDGADEFADDAGTTSEPADDTDTTGEAAGDTDTADEPAGDADTADEPAGDAGTADEPAGDAGTTGEAAGDGAADELDADDFDDGMYEMDDEEREELEAEFGTEFTTGADVDEPGESDIDVPEPDEGTTDDATSDATLETDTAETDDGDLAEAPASSLEGDTQSDLGDGPESSLEDAGDDVDASSDDAGSDSATRGATDEPAAESDTDEPDAGSDATESADEIDDGPADDGPADDVDLQTYVVETMNDLDDGDGADRTELVETVAADTDAAEADVEDAIQDALMGGECYEPNDDTLKAI